jgi:mycofactocin glycosyltransferase
LRAEANGFFVVSPLPLRGLKVNASLFRLLEFLRDGGEAADYLSQNPALNPVNINQTLLTLVSHGYLKLEKIPRLTVSPRVSVIVPVRDRPNDLLDCLKSLEKLDYPQDMLDIIIVDDGSQKPVSQLVTLDIVKIIRHEVSQGPAACRNIGAQNARGAIFAFLDADCQAGENWLAEIVPFFQSAGVGAAGGYVDGYYRKSWLDRYEKAFSSLNMGKRLLIEAKSDSGFYVPTANFLVTREAFTAAGGFNEALRTGEDVDFCWRLRDLGYTLLYTPSGSVAHKHRNRLDRMLQRRAQYGMSEAVLYRAHRVKKKGFTISPYAGLSFLAMALALLLLNPYPLLTLPLLFAIDLWRKSAMLKKYKMSTSFPSLVASALRSYLSFFYFTFFHLARYYLVLIIGLGVLWYPVWIFAGLSLIWPSLVDYFVKKPQLFYPVFLFYYFLEHLAYQVGVFWGCLKTGYFGSYLLSFKKA